MVIYYADDISAATEIFETHLVKLKEVLNYPLKAAF